MIKIENVVVHGFEAAVRGMRNPLNSWNKSDSCKCMCLPEITCKNCIQERFEDDCTGYIIGKEDLKLMRKLCKAGPEHRKFMRQIVVSMDITAPLYWWKEFDTYKIGTTANSCSTMHKIHAKPFVKNDFSCEHLFNEGANEFLKDFEYTIHALNMARIKYLDTKDKKYWWQMIQLLPTSYNQMRTVTLNYEIAYTMLKQRKNHKLDEWHVVAEEFANLPYMTEITNI